MKALYNLINTFKERGLQENYLHYYLLYFAGLQVIKLNVRRLCLII